MGERLEPYLEHILPLLLVLPLKTQVRESIHTYKQAYIHTYIHAYICKDNREMFNFASSLFKLRTNQLVDALIALYGRIPLYHPTIEDNLLDRMAQVRSFPFLFVSILVIQIWRVAMIRYLIFVYLHVKALGCSVEIYIHLLTNGFTMDTCAYVFLKALSDCPFHHPGGPPRRGRSDNARIDSSLRYVEQFLVCICVYFTCVHR